MHICICTFAHIYIYIYMRIYIYTIIQICIYAYIQVYVCICISTFTYIIYTYILYICMIFLGGSQVQNSSGIFQRIEMARTCTRLNSLVTCWNQSCHCCKLMKQIQGQRPKSRNKMMVCVSLYIS